jgi:hypothetical protein
MQLHWEEMHLYLHVMQHFRHVKLDLTASLMPMFTVKSGSNCIDIDTVRSIRRASQRNPTVSIFSIQLEWVGPYAGMGLDASTRYCASNCIRTSIQFNPFGVHPDAFQYCGCI